MRNKKDNGCNFYYPQDWNYEEDENYNNYFENDDFNDDCGYENNNYYTNNNNQNFYKCRCICERERHQPNCRQKCREEKTYKCDQKSNRHNNNNCSRKNCCFLIGILSCFK